MFGIHILSQALEINPRDCWSTHAKVHVMEDTNRAGEGIVFMEKTEQDWTVCMVSNNGIIVSKYVGLMLVDECPW